MKEETKTFVIMVKINGQEAIVLLDSGCTTEAISPEMVQIVGLKAHQLTEQIPIQLGTKGRGLYCPPYILCRSARNMWNSVEFHGIRIEF